jgi:hypothetical protein
MFSLGVSVDKLSKTVTMIPIGEDDYAEDPENRPNRRTTFSRDDQSLRSTSTAGQFLKLLAHFVTCLPMLKLQHHMMSPLSHVCCLCEVLHIIRVCLAKLDSRI